jgi:histone deacetylase 6
MLHDIIRQWQASQLYDSHKLTQLHIFRNKVSKSFDQQVLATPGWDSKKNLLVIFHDPPDMLLGPRNPVEDGSSVRYDLHETWLVSYPNSFPVSMLIAWVKVDHVKSLIDHAVAAGFGCIDVNIPKSITPGPEDDQTIPMQALHDDSPEVARHQSTLLASYIWDNYIAPSDNSRVFFVGIGNAFQGITRLLSEKQEVHEITAGVVAFIANNPLRPVANENFEIRGSSLAGWYSQNSRVWLSHTHSAWKRDKRLGKKFGMVEKSDEMVLGLMVKRYMDEAWRWILERTHDPGETGEDEAVGDATILVPVEQERQSRAMRDGEDVVMERS